MNTLALQAVAVAQGDAHTALDVLLQLLMEHARQSDAFGPHIHP